MGKYVVDVGSRFSVGHRSLVSKNVPKWIDFGAVQGRNCHVIKILSRKFSSESYFPGVKIRRKIDFFG